jgi:polyhydroxyalkanoate synthesis regulator phasin
MSRRTKLIIVGLVGALLAAALVGWAMAQGQGAGEQPATTTPTTAPFQSFLSRVAANLGVSETKLLEAITQARLQMIDEAVQQGWLTQEQATLMKQRISASQALLQMVDEALKQGKITQEQAAWMRQQIAGRGAIGCGPFGFGWGKRGRWGWGGRGW